MQTDATLLDVTCCICLHTLLHVVLCFCELLHNTLKLVKLLATCKWTQQCYVSLQGALERKLHVAYLK